MAESRPRIVVFSSDRKEGRLISRHLKGKAFQVIRAEGPADRFGYLEKDPDLVLLDLSIKECWRILRQAKKVRQAKNGKRNGHSHLPVVVFDHQRNPLKEIKAFHLGADGYVGRPLMKEELLSAVGSFIWRKKMEANQSDLVKLERKEKEGLALEKRRLEASLKRLQEFNERIASNVPLSIVIVDQEKRVTYVNRNFCHAMGRDPEELLGRPLESVFPETFYGPLGLLDKVDGVLRGGPSTLRFSMTYRGDSYTYRILPIASRRRVDGHTEKQAMILIENVSELKTLGERVQISEEKYRALFEGSPDGILVTRRGGGRILELNHQAERVLSQKRRDLKKRSLLHLYPTDTRPILKTRLRKRGSSKDSLELPELTLNGYGEAHRILAVSASPILHRGEPALLCVMKDISERRFLEEQVRQSEKMSLLGQFTAGAAHEINNPLAIISSHAQYLLTELEGERLKRRGLSEIRETLNLIDRESRYCGAIIKNLLAYTHTREALKKPVDLAGVIEQILKMVEHQIALSNVAVASKIDGAPLAVLGDANLLQQVLMNLIWNSQAAMPKGGRLTIGACRAGKELVEVSVEDTGIGIPGGNIEKIFTPFFTTKEIGKGTGLGLWVVRSIVDEHQGKIEVDSKVGKGTRFTIRFPAYLEKDGNDSRH